VSTITVHSRRFGRLAVAPSDVIDFPEGLIGLRGTRFVLIPAGGDSPFAWLQSAEDPDLAIPVADPWTFFDDFWLEISDETAMAASLPADGTDVTVWVTVRAADDLRDFCANLRAPIVVHAGRGAQVLNEAPGADVRAPLFPERALAAA
jgi:flagellar assembly factor FliW